MKIYGGFAGTENSLDQRDPSYNITVLSGDIDQDDISDSNKITKNAVEETDDGNAMTQGDLRGNNSYHVIYADGTTTPITSNTLIDGLVVTGGWANGNEDVGGGMVCNGEGSTNSGANCSPTLNQVRFIGNAARLGGAVLNQGFSGKSSPTLTDVDFVGNAAITTNNGYGLGGAMYNNGISGNSSPTLNRVSFFDNAASFEGGAMYNESTIDLDRAGESSPILTNVKFVRNAAGRAGGAMYNNGYPYGIISPILNNVSFVTNRAVDGGAFFNDARQAVSRPKLNNVTFVNNHADSNGGAIFQYGADNNGALRITNSIFWENEHDGPYPAIVNAGGEVTVSYSLFDQSFAGNFTDADHNKFDRSEAPFDPDNADISNGDLPLASCSEAIDAGDNSANTTSTDLAGNPRRVDDTRVTDITGQNAPVIDMGAFERQNRSGCPEQLYVKADATGSNDGSSWENAYTKLQDALAKWTLAGYPGGIWVARGVYYPDEGASQADNNRDASFNLEAGLKLYGGFAGTESSLDQRNLELNVTVLSGDIDKNDTNKDSHGITPTASDIQGENTYQMIYMDGTKTPITTTTIIDGLVVTGGWLGGMDCDGSGGGDCSPTLSYVDFVGISGGAMFNGGRDGNSSPTTKPCEIYVQ
ncbi:MAG: choice-of-anchor Q domain-containing protein [Deinococcales bacterium]